ncbi:RNA polymerase subunit sigma [Rathayibacter sp. AY1E9]|nr:RNA polymerase subunit sigma [Rathayibacter sp. AY1C6]PPG23952.1 RNA polymerase subunit sigma [Rathayibacter sp. AY1E8]PPG54418.1 RNA polymerase subunit sigma [Rathayibacter sp. AY1E9]PPG60589.1 RNA polymerase subunit sigma [Rathayibacter sp. AY1C5]PPH24174.1 RNA polymerase subunit sigma [Rathayibacter sp. AY1C4]PPH33515.1 RNA polymerase subunit sigma [Rathayibacter sp. AY1C3]PPH47332.1 RNA polymerase subunit sigma [Rathayibacter sp. AY1C9]PPH66074.1 RNA polymerase subunit sigma [Rathayib
MSTMTGKRREPGDSPARSAALLLRVCAGDRTAFRQLYSLTAGRVVSVADAVLDDRAAAEEVAQEVYLELWRTARSLDPGRPVLAFLAQVAHRRAVDRARADRSARRRELQYTVLDRPRDHEWERSDVRLALAPAAGAIRQLAAIHHDVLYLAYVRGYSHSEIAEELSIPLGTVKTRLRDTLIRLHTHLQSAGPADPDGGPGRRIRH